MNLHETTAYFFKTDNEPVYVDGASYWWCRASPWRTNEWINERRKERTSERMKV